MFINFTNHPSSQWGEAQLAAARCYGPLQDIPFPSITPALTGTEVRALARQYAERIAAAHPTAVLCQGEHSFCFALISQLLSQGITVLSACAVRNAKEYRNAQGKMEKYSVFDFVAFREYTR